MSAVYQFLAYGHPPLKTADIHSACYWVKQLTGTVVGIIFGVTEVTGAQGFAFFLTINLLVTFIVYSKVLRVNVEELGFEGQAKLVQEGFMQSFGCFLLCWIVSFTLCVN
mmetsp:Transcript_45065/g.74752  ORF Transcript_45065/g.74752 Transcript_45065/m.74752 type:complete len:110 (-) Transcript_45065:314-643(-)